MSEYIYQYWKELPRYQANKFDIIGHEHAPPLREHMERLGAYYNDDENLDFVFDEEVKKIISIGGYTSGSKSASTVEPGLWEMFGYKHKHTVEKKIRDFKKRKSAKSKKKPKKKTTKSKPKRKSRTSKPKKRGGNDISISTDSDETADLSDAEIGIIGHAIISDDIIGSDDTDITKFLV